MKIINKNKITTKTQEPIAAEKATVEDSVDVRTMGEDYEAPVVPDKQKKNKV